MLRIGVDTGGTFTDFVVIRNGVVEVFKELSTPKRPDDAIMAGIARANAHGRIEIIHGSTVGTNALLERKGARSALITTAGFEDVIVIGRQTRRELYNIDVTRPEPLAPEELRLGVRERVLYDGSVLTPLDTDQVRQLVETLRARKAESVAVSLLFSFANPGHEQQLGLALRALGVPVSLSSEVLPEYREYERTSTTLINAYLAPVMSKYLGSLEQRTSGASLKVMQSNGGAVRARTAAERPVQTILSGPAGGVVGAFHVARLAGYSKVITFDMGGTSTDVALCDGGIKVTQESQVDGMPVGVSMMDIHTVGAGGGSIAEMDAGGALKVGPESAGADPGPICYGTGERLTVTDANVLLGRLLPRFFLGGAMPLHADRIVPLASSQRWSGAWRRIEDLAQGVVDVVNNNMEQAIRLISVERGFDPRDFTLVCFGGAGGLHAVSLAAGLGIPRVLVPKHPGALSAVGLLIADARKDYSRTLLIDAATAGPRVRAALSELHRIGRRDMRAEGFGLRKTVFEDWADLRYRGQSYEITVPWSPRAVEDFHRAHEKRYGHRNPGQPVELVNIRTRFIGKVDPPPFAKAARVRTQAQPVAVHDVWFSGKRLRARIYDRDTLGFGHVIAGPAIVGEYSSTTWIPPGVRCSVDAHLNLIITL